jgi:hypothetical protein
MTTTNLASPPSPSAVAAANEAQAADAELKRRARELLLSNRHELLCQLLDRWYTDTPTAVLAWLRNQPGERDGGAAHV